MTTKLVEPTTTAQTHVETAWRLFDGPARYGAFLSPWTTSPNGDGQPIATTTVNGQHANAALHRFASTYPVVLADPGDQHPQLSYTDTGSEVTMRSGGVWIRLVAA
ncbi:hypothetical protein ACFXJO_05745 [Streptomyces lavendulae]|uniref:hypothetical protein n=1 Tax=Streptomyces lavendulae TaxID=1914 RepID=UPI0036AB65C7